MSEVQKQPIVEEAKKEVFSLEDLQNGVYEVPAELFSQIFNTLAEFPAKVTLPVLNRMSALRPRPKKE